MPAPLNLTGQRFGRLLVGPRTTNVGKKVRWLCRCDCGKDSLALTNDLRSGRHASCGCLQLERVTKHGHSPFDIAKKSLTYRSWISMVNRCTSEKATGYANYGGRGIKVCDRWRDFRNFLADMGERPSLGHSIDRFPNVDGNYEPGNVRWATRAEQAVNRRNNRRFTHEGETLTVIEWCRKLGIAEHLLRSRLKLGWTFADAIASTDPLPATRDRIDMAGKRFGRLAIIGSAPSVDGRAMWECRCDCGNTYVGVGKFLRQGRVTSCGCGRGKKQK
jgi:hypothetical protein